MMSVFLVGFMGVGKSFWGEKLSSELGFHFLDTDKYIVKSEQMSILEIFQTKGEDYFRNLEREFIVNYKGEKDVVAVGGGLPIFDQNMTLLNSKGLTIFINEPFEVCFERIRNSGRPLLDNNSKDTLEKLHHKRLPIYKESKITIDSPNNVSDFISVLD